MTIEFGVTILATGYWPSYSGISLRLPRQMKACLEVFEQFYSKETQHRKLTWMNSLGQATVMGRFYAATVRRHEILGSTLQGVVLLLFANGESYSALEVQKLLVEEDTQAALPEKAAAAGNGGAVENVGSSNLSSLSLAEVKKVLGTLCCAKFKVLSLRRDGELLEAPKTVLDADVISVNK